MENKQSNTLGFINLYKILATFCILFCHMVQFNNSGKLIVLSSYLVAGVNMFFISSGFCNGLKGSITEPFKWYKNRIISVFVPYELFVVFLFFLTLYKNVEILPVHWVLLVFGLQGADVHVLGAEHTWFISSLLFCYLLTPLFSIICGKINSKKQMILLFSGLLVFYIAASLVLYDFIVTLFLPSVFYLIAYFVGRNYDNIKRKTSYFIISLISLIGAAGIRTLVGIMQTDVTPEIVLFVNLSLYVIAFSLLYIFYYLFFNFKDNKISSFLSSIGFEIYLYQMLPLLGPLYMHVRIINWWQITAIDIAIVLAISVSMHFIGVAVKNIIKKKRI